MLQSWLELCCPRTRGQFWTDNTTVNYELGPKRLGVILDTSQNEYCTLNRYMVGSWGTASNCTGRFINCTYSLLMNLTNTRFELSAFFRRTVLLERAVELIENVISRAESEVHFSFGDVL